MILKIGDTAAHTFAVSDEIVRGFAELTGDRNPVHLDDEFAQSTRFGRRIAHGMIAASQISAAIGNTVPGPGTIYLSQSLQFLAPVFVGDMVTTRVTVISIKEGKPIATLETVCENQRGEVVLQGEAVVLFPQEIKG
ncbi:MAG: MaoC family dehydratase [Acidobacteriia bacterium]|nr:MaoC family dehydratase [Terriglobia bacterium]